jgi:tripeptide aminopeptidase
MKPTSATIDADRLLDRFLRYVKIDTTADDAASVYPSSPGQLTLGALLADELRAMGLQNVEHDEHGLVWGTVPPTVSHAAPVVALNAHLDTSPETTGKNVHPQVIRDYAGGDLALPGDASKVIRVAENPTLKNLRGKTLITADGTTLLGSDDKSGVAAIMELAQYLMEHREIPHGPVRVLFTCDEEIGLGVKHVDLKKLGATAAYTLDGAGINEIDIETFSADLATVTVHGVNIHPSIGKGRMVNSLRVAGRFLDRLPLDQAPETTEDRQGFLHPYAVEGGVAFTTLKILLRDFDTAQLAAKAELMRNLAAEVQREFPGARVEVTVKKQYRNMAEGLTREPRAVALAQEAFRRLGRPHKLTIVRGGTDGSQFTELGLPTPNLSTGEHNPHSPLEWTCLEEMVAAVEMLVELVQLWSNERAE